MKNKILIYHQSKSGCLCHHCFFTFDFLWNLFLLFFLPAACAVFSATICWYFFLFFLKREKEICFKTLKTRTRSKKPMGCVSGVTRILGSDPTSLSITEASCKLFNLTVRKHFHLPHSRLSQKPQTYCLNSASASSSSTIVLFLFFLGIRE